MANRNFNRFQALEKEVKALYAEVSIGNAGAPTLVSGLGVESITKNNTGDYTVKLQDKYMSLKACDVSILSTTVQDLTIQLYSESVATSKEIRFLTVEAGLCDHPASGSKLLIKIEVKNSSV